MMVVRVIWDNPFLRFLLLAAAVVAAYLLLRATTFVWGSFAIAFLIAYLLAPMVSFVERRGAPRGVGVMAAAGLFLVLVAGLWVLGTAIAAQLAEFAEELPRMMDTVEGLPFVIARFVDPSYGAIFEQVFLSTQLLALTLVEGVLPSVADVGEAGVAGVLGQVGSVGMQVTIVLVLSLYLLYRYPVYGEAFLSAVPSRHRASFEALAEKASFSVGGYIRGQVLISAFVGIFAGIGLTALGVPLAPALGVLAGVFNIIPFFGPLLVAVPTAVLALTVSFGHLVAALAVLFLVNQVDAHVLTPLIYARTISLDPVTIVLSILTGLALFGLIGALVAVPLAAFVKLLYHDYYVGSSWYAAGGRPRVETEV